LKFFYFSLHSSSQQAAETVAFSSSSLKSASGSGDFWGTELAWQRDELSKTFVVSVSKDKLI